MNLLTILSWMAVGVAGPASAPESSGVEQPTAAAPAEQPAEAPADAGEGGTVSASGEATLAPVAAPDGEAAAASQPPPGEAAPGEAAPGADPSWDAVGASGQTGTVDPTAVVEPAPVVQPAPIPPAPTRPPRPIRWRLDFEIGGGTTIVGDRGFRAFGENRSLPESHAAALFDFRLAQIRFFLGGGVAYHGLNREGDAYGALVTTSMRLHEPELMGRVSVMAVEGIDAFGLIGVGPSFIRSEYYSSEAASQKDVIPRVDAYGGLNLYLPKAWLPPKQAARITAGLQLGLGYTWRGVLEIQPALEQDDDPLRSTSAALGDLNLHGLAFRGALVIRVM